MCKERESPLSHYFTYEIVLTLSSVLLQQAPTVVAEYVRVSLQTQTTVALAETSVPEIASTANVTVQLRIRSVLRLEIAARPATHVSTVVLAQDAATTLNSVRLHLSPAVPLFAARNLVIQ
ncbi:uncharacterized protein N7473_013045 [Penicillium subrubescens]|uniref:uncharacterized protein n=1 Tax=Penicillium subrubescens TaxID=1316194 RepID=UPI0025454935|nr:uncharacterized protein N7473_013045 [Penicillium subrubescens]KAJ5875698.1 hypothetical protein N7473_013045 [Penicillium subrubescens]